MSRIMQELKQSELRGYQSHHVPNSAVAISKKKGSSLAMGLLLLLVPSLLVGVRWLISLILPLLKRSASRRRQCLLSLKIKRPLQRRQ